MIYSFYFCKELCETRISYAGDLYNLANIGFLKSFQKSWKTETARSSHRRCSMKKGVLKAFSKFIGKHLCQSLFVNKFAGLSLQLYEKRDCGADIFLLILRNF